MELLKPILSFISLHPLITFIIIVILLFFILYDKYSGKIKDKLKKPEKKEDEIDKLIE